MSGLYQHFLTLVLITTAALLSTFLLYPRNMSHAPVDLQNAIRRMYDSFAMTSLRIAYQNTCKVVHAHARRGQLLPFFCKKRGSTFNRVCGYTRTCGSSTGAGQVDGYVGINPEQGNICTNQC